MFPLIKNIYICACPKVLVRKLSVSCRKFTQFSEHDDDFNYFAFKTGLSRAEQSKILYVLNTASSEQLLRYNVSKRRIKNMEIWKNQRGDFKSFSDVLEVDGLGEKILEKICKDIIDNNLVERDIPGGLKSPITTSEILMHRKVKQFTTPVLLKPVIDAVSLIHKIPSSDIYVLENKTSLSSKTQQSVSYNQQTELTSMLLALLNTSFRHNLSLNDPNSEIVANKVYFLRTRLPARLFGLIIGSEKIASVRTVNDLLNDRAGDQPCSPIIFDPQLKDMYDSQLPATKDLLGHALLLILSFMDVCVYKNSVSLNVLFNSHLRKKVNIV